MYNTHEQQKEANKRWGYLKYTEIVDGKIIGSQQPYFYVFKEKMEFGNDAFVWRRFAAGLAYNDESADEWCKAHHPDKYDAGVLMERQ
jgi:hypothetical protein